MKKILIITFEYPLGKNYCGGVGQIVKLSREALAREGHKVYVLISSGLQKKHAVKLLNPDNSLEKYSSLSAFQKDFSWDNFDYIIQNFVNWTKELEKIKHKTKIIYHFHSILRREKDLGFKTLNRFLVNQEKMIKIANKVICPSRYEYDNFMRYFPNFSDKVFLVENTIDIFPAQRKIIKEIRQKHEIGKRDIVSIYVGRLEKIKGAELIIRNINKSLKKFKHLKMFIIGKTLERDLYYKFKKIQKRFPRQLFYIRFLEKEVLFQYYYLSHIFVNPSLSESFSLATHEAAYCRTALLLNPLPVFDKFKRSAIFWENPVDETFVYTFEKLLRHRKVIKNLAEKAARQVRKELPNNNFSKDLCRIIK